MEPSIPPPSPTQSPAVRGPFLLGRGNPSSRALCQVAYQGALRALGGNEPSGQVSPTCCGLLCRCAAPYRSEPESGNSPFVVDISGSLRTMRGLQRVPIARKALTLWL